MRNILIILTVITLGILTGYSLPIFAGAVNIPGGEIIAPESMEVTTTSTDPTDLINEVGFKILGFAKLLISGVALIYLVLIGVYMVMYSENEEKIKSQRKQITYALIGFLFLNIPGVIYTSFFYDQGATLTPGSYGWQSTTGGSVFWNIGTFGDSDGLFMNIISFLKVFIFGVAIIMFTWGLFRMIISAGDDEARKIGRNRLVYGTLGLIFLGFVEGWSTLVAEGNFAGDIATTGGKLLGIALYFAAPIAVFFLIWGSYFYITSGGDEERVKKGKTIIINTFIATLILLASLSFMKDLIGVPL